MQTIKLQTGEHTDDSGQVHSLSTRDLILYTLNHPGSGGLSFEDFQKRKRIEIALEKSNGSIDLEDQDYENLKTLVRGMKWGMRAKFIEDFLQTFY